MKKCWKCEEEVERGGIFCPACKTIQPPANIDHFTRLGLEPNYEIGEKILEVAYFAKQRSLHPDLFIKKSEKEKKYSMGHTVDVNDAYETLKSPLKRAEYLLKLQGIIVNKDNADSVRPSQALLMESLEAREELDSAKKPEKIRAIMVHAIDERMACIDEIKQQLADGNFDSAAQNTIKLRYLEKLIEEAKLQGMKVQA